MANVPNTTTSGQVLTSVGDGSNASKWGTITSGGGSTLPTGTSTGQMIWWNGTAWIVTSTTGLTTNYVMTWNGTAWVPTAGGNTLGGYAVNVTGVGNGDVLYWSNVGAVQQWLTGPTPTGDGQLQYWNTASSGHWSVSAAATSTGQALVWNNSTLTWGPSSVPLVGDVSGTTSSNQVVSLAGGQTLALTGGNFPVSGSIMQYSTSTSAWTTGAAPTQNGQILQWNGFAWAQSDTPAPSNGQTLVWNSAIAPTGKWTPGGLTLAGDVTGSSGANTVVKIQNYPVNITGLTGTGGFMFYDSTGSQFVFSGTPLGTGSIMYWNGSGYVSSPAPGGTGYLQWTGSAYTFGTGGGGGGLTNNDAGNLYLSTAQAQAPSGQRYPVDASGGSYVQNYAARGAMTYTTTGASAGLVVGTTGVYHITGQIAITPGAALSQLQAQIVAGGAQIATSQAGTVAASQNEYLQVSCDWYMTSGTLIQLAWYFVNASGTTSRTLTTTNTFISAHLVSS